MRRRGSGILLHITSLPSPYGIGDLGPGAYRFADFLSDSRQGLWQILPLNPTSPGQGNSPYYSDSAFAGNPLLISPDQMVREGLLSKSDLRGLSALPEGRADYPAAERIKSRLLKRAFQKRKGKLKTDREFERFCLENAGWLEEYALFRALKGHFKGLPWLQWPEEIRGRRGEAVKKYSKILFDDILSDKFVQFVFFQQWFALKRYCAERGVEVMGDLPLYVQHDSADVWAHSELFKLDDLGRMRVVAGVPPDYFSETGQRWGSPVYRWDALKASGYRWWINRMAHNLGLFHRLRLDHFRGLVAYWEIPVEHPTALHGRWVQAPAEDFLAALFKRFPVLPLIAEDLGVITPDVREVMRRFGLPGMRLLLFAFGEDLAGNSYAPHNHERNCVVYTGTHDNNTARGWFQKEAAPEDRERLSTYLGRRVEAKGVHWELVRLAMMSVADTAILPMQDLLGLGEEARMNHPARENGNWLWRLAPNKLTAALSRRLDALTYLCGRG